MTQDENFEKLAADICEAVLFADARQHNFPIVGASQGFQQLTGHPFERMLGLSMAESLVRPDGLAAHEMSRSALQDMENFCCACRRQDVGHIGEIEAVLPGVRPDGSKFMSVVTLGLCRKGGNPYILAVQHPYVDGLMNRVSQKEVRAAADIAMDTLRRVRKSIQSRDRWMSPEFEAANSPEKGPGATSSRANPDFEWFVDRLQDHSIISSDRLTAERREPAILPRGCLVLSNNPIRRRKEGLGFRMRVDSTVAFCGYPTMGFTRRKPVNDHGVYPTVAKCLGASVLVGEDGATARDFGTNFEIGFKAPPTAELQSWPLTSEDKALRKDTPMREGDIVSCIYTPEGLIQLWMNDMKRVEYDVGRPIDDDAQYYAVFDVSFSVSSATVLPWEHPRRGTDQQTSIEGVETDTSDVNDAAFNVKSIGDLSTVATMEEMQGQVSDLFCLSEQSSDAVSILGVDLDSTVDSTFEPHVISRESRTYAIAVVLGLCTASFMIGFRLR